MAGGSGGRARPRGVRNRAKSRHFLLGFRPKNPSSVKLGSPTGEWLPQRDGGGKSLGKVSVRGDVQKSVEWRGGEAERWACQGWCESSMKGRRSRDVPRGPAGGDLRR